MEQHNDPTMDQIMAQLMGQIQEPPQQPAYQFVPQPGYAAPKQKRPKKKRKVLIWLIPLVAVLVLTVSIFMVLLLTVEARVTGIWVGGPVYLSHYSDRCYRSLALSEDGTCSDILTDSDVEILTADIGTWSVSGFDIEIQEYGEPGQTVYHYNPITNTLTSGSWTLDKAE